MYEFKIKPFNFYHLNAHLSEFHSNWHKENGIINWPLLEAVLKPFVSELVSEEEREGEFHQVIDIGQPTGWSTSKETTEKDIVFWAIRPGRDIPSRFVEVPDDFQKAEIKSLVLHGEWRNGDLRLYTIYPADGLGTYEIYDPKIWEMSNAQLLEESISFWRSVALIPTGDEIRLPDEISQEIEEAIQASNSNQTKFYLVPDFKELHPSEVDDFDEWLGKVQKIAPHVEVANSIVLCFLYEYDDRPNIIYPHILLSQADFEKLKNDILIQKFKSGSVFQSLKAMQSDGDYPEGGKFFIHSVYATDKIWGTRWEEWGDGDTGEIFISENSLVRHHSDCHVSARPLEMILKTTGMSLVEKQSSWSLSEYGRFRRFALGWCIEFLLDIYQEETSPIKSFAELMICVILLQNDTEFICEHPFL